MKKEFQKLLSMSKMWDCNWRDDGL